MALDRHPISALPGALAGLLVLMACTGAWAAGPSAASQAQARFLQDMAVCNSGRSPQDRTTCRREARSALAEGRRGGLVDAPESYQTNQLQRCRALEGTDRSACEGRMRGEGSVEGSVAGGGILRESTTVVVPARP